MDNKHLLRNLQRHASTYHQGNLMKHKNVKFLNLTNKQTIVCLTALAWRWLNKAKLKNLQFMQQVQFTGCGWQSTVYCLLYQYFVSKSDWCLRLFLRFFQPTKTGSSPKTASVLTKHIAACGSTKTPVCRFQTPLNKLSSSVRTPHHTSP